jgi:LPS-assembly protein
MGESLSVFSNKSYRKNQGKYFEAVGNVVILHGKETLYGEAASIDMEKGIFKIEGNVRFISQDVTVYGSSIVYMLNAKQLEIKNARIATEGYNIVAKRLNRVDEYNYTALEAEFSTCRDCPESWTIYGDEIRLTLGDYIRIRHALFKINSVNVMYVPYIIFPAKKRRETGLLFPKISTRLSEGLAFEQPWFWAINDQSDLTLGPTFWAKRGLGVDTEYRHVFNDQSWMQVNSRMLNDEIYLPGKLDRDRSNDKFFRHFTVFEDHYQYANFMTHHLKYNFTRDIDIVRDHPLYTDPHIRGSELSAEGFFDFRFDRFAVNSEFTHNRNLLFDQPVEFDRSYVQTLPSLSVETTPWQIFKSEVPMFKSLHFDFTSNFTRFGQLSENDTTNLRNYNRRTFNPSLNWNLFTLGPVNLQTQFKLDMQDYQFHNESEEDFKKFATLTRTELSFGLERVFGLSYMESVTKTSMSSSGEKIKKSFGVDMIGELPMFEVNFTDGQVLMPKNSYKHNQEFKFIHHYLADEEWSGNQRYFNQIQTSAGWADYVDAIRSREFLQGSNITRTQVSPYNTLEFQWNNSLIRKSPKTFNVLEDYRYLRDNFLYNKIGYFNLSQGLEFKTPSNQENELTRLLIDTGYNSGEWNFGLREYYFHQTQESITSASISKQFNFFRVFTSMNFNNLEQANLKTTTLGAHFRASDMFGFTANYEYDWQADSTVRSLYSFDYLPANNCWKLNLNYRKTIVDSRFSFDFTLNYGTENFSRPDERVNRF